MTNRELRFEAEELLDRYVQCLDEDRLEEWPDFFSDKAVRRALAHPPCQDGGRPKPRPTRRFSAAC